VPLANDIDLVVGYMGTAVEVCGAGCCATGMAGAALQSNVH